MTTSLDLNAALARPGLLNAVLAAPNPLQWVLGIFVAVATLIYWEQFRFRAARATSSGKLIPGPERPFPLVGGIVEMVMNPFAFWEKQRVYSDPGMSYNSLVGKFILFITDAEKCREVMSINDPASMLMSLHPSAKNILGPNNLAFMHGPEHKNIRKSFLSLFTRKALGLYVEIQEVFVGPYLDDPEVTAKFSKAYRVMTEAFLAFPVCLPGTAVWKGKQGRLYILKVLATCARRSVAYVRAGGEPRCLMDFWSVKCLQEIEEAAAEGVPPPPHTTEHRMADAMLDFLFASQDASTASLTWCLTLLEERPEVLARVRAEQAALRPDLATTITGEVLAQMTYTRQVVKEVLRFRPPAPMVPSMVYADYRLTEDYVVPRGTMVVPSIVSANMQGFPDPHTFDPDRFGPERKEDIVHARNFLTFGHGPHYCVGKEYAINQLTCFLAILSMATDWSRRRTEKSSEWVYLPTIYPADALITFSPRA
ncbi:hypothetical protein ACKKBF_B09810 [Auxenochlorella protothecoides x Auxenochlorella symbiontica]